MNRLLLWGLLIAALPFPCAADSSRLPPEQRHALIDAARFHPISTVAALPRGVQALCADANGRIADPGQPWELGDYIRDQALPRKRLIWAATDGERYVVHYESGGRGHGFHVLLATVRDGGSRGREIWHAIGYPLKDYADFVDALQSHRLDDTPRPAR